MVTSVTSSVPTERRRAASLPGQSETVRVAAVEPTGPRRPAAFVQFVQVGPLRTFVKAEASRRQALVAAERESTVAIRS